MRNMQTPMWVRADIATTYLEGLDEHTFRVSAGIDMKDAGCGRRLCRSGLVGGRWLVKPPHLFLAPGSGLSFGVQRCHPLQPSGPAVAVRHLHSESLTYSFIAEGDGPVRPAQPHVGLQPGR